MDNANYHNPADPNFERLKPVDEDLGKPISLDDLDKPIPPGGAGPVKANVSHTPLNLGGPPAATVPPAGRVASPAPSAGRVASPAPPAGRVAAPATPAAPAAPVAQVQMPKGAISPPAPKVVSSARITGVKTFFTKLHPGAIEFLDEQICMWLKGNPGVSIKQTNVTTGLVQSKKTEPNILITVWY